jgi:predicted anti-sigma-YlaC factor YlaD
VKVTRAVIHDLLPLYLEGEASADSRSLVEAYLRQDEEFARLVRAAADERSALMTAQTVTALSPDIERRALERTRTVLRRQGWTLGLAIFLTLLPFTVGDLGEGRTFFMLRDVPESAWLWVPAGMLWLRYTWTRRKLRGSGF